MGLYTKFKPHEKVSRYGKWIRRGKQQSIWVRSCRIRSIALKELSNLFVFCVYAQYYPPLHRPTFDHRYVATEAAYTKCEPWRRAFLSHLRSNRDLVYNFIKEKMPELHMEPMQVCFEMRSSSIRDVVYSRSSNMHEMFLLQHIVEMATAHG